MLLRTYFSQKLARTFESTGKQSKQRGAAMSLNVDTAVLADRHAVQTSLRAPSCLIPGLSPSLQARHAVYLKH